MRVRLTTTAIFGDLSGYFFGIFRDKASNIVWRYCYTHCRPVTDCKMNYLEWPWVALTVFWRQNPFSASVAKWMHLLEPTAQIWMKIDPHYQRQNVGQCIDCSFWKYRPKVHADIRGGSPWPGRQTTLGVVDDGNFWRFRWLHLWKLQRYGKQYYNAIRLVGR